MTTPNTPARDVAIVSEIPEGVRFSHVVEHAQEAGTLERVGQYPPGDDAAMSDETAAELRALLAKATPVPWVADDLVIESAGCAAIGRLYDVADFPCVETEDEPIIEAEQFANAALIVAAVNALPATLARMDQDAAMIAGLRGVLDGMANIAESAALLLDQLARVTLHRTLDSAAPLHRDILATAVQLRARAALSDPRS